MARWKVLAIAIAIAIPWLAAGTAYDLQVINVHKRSYALARLFFFSGHAYFTCAYRHAHKL